MYFIVNTLSVLKAKKIKMKKILIIVTVVLLAQMAACKKSEFADYYTDPSKIGTAVLERQYAGFLNSSRDYVLPQYWNYFVALRTTLHRYIQTTGYANTTSQYVPGASANDSRWSFFYTMLTQYRELEYTLARLPKVEQDEKKVFHITATIYLYDQLQKMVDIYGDIPFSTAGLIHENGGDYIGSAATYDSAEELYTKMLDDLKAYASELNSLTLIPSVKSQFEIQDFVNLGDLNNWKRYCNSLRLRILTRVSGVSQFQSRVASELNEIVSNPSTYPLVISNEQNIQMNVTNQDTDINSRGFQTGLEDWNGNIAGKKMVDFMKATSDPRLRLLFEPGANAGGVYNGLDQTLNEANQVALINGGTISIYNRYTLSRNQFFPGVLMNAAEVSFLLAEVALKGGQDAAARTAYEKGIAESVEFYKEMTDISNATIIAKPAPPTSVEIAAYIASADVVWTGATTEAQKLDLIAMQKWLHFNVIQSYENWSEVRRLNAPAFDFWVDSANPQTLPPNRWNYSALERTYNSENYKTVSGKDNLTTKIFWDVD